VAGAGTRIRRGRRPRAPSLWVLAVAGLAFVGASRVGDDMPVIILSAYEDPALKSEAAAANTYAYLVKGCSGGLVLDTIEQAFQATR
jgi:DNA-binding NarL/FixJ family response regulator